MFPSSITRTPMRPGSRRVSIASRRSDSFGVRPSGSFVGGSSSRSDLRSPNSPYGVFVADSEDEGPSEHSLPAPRKRQSLHSGGQALAPERRDSRRQSTQGEGYFGYRPDHPTSGGDDRRDDEVFTSPLISPNQPSTAFDKIKSFIGFSRPEYDEETGLGRKRRPRSGSRSGRASTSSHDSERRSASPSSSENSWGYGNQDDGYSDLNREEGYSSSMADDTSLPPQSRPQSPHLPLIPNASDDIFGDPASRGQDLAEPKEFTNVALPSRQNVLLPDEDLSIRFIGYRTDPVRNALWWAGCIVTFGALGLFGHWVPSIWVKFCGKETAFEDAREGSWLVVEVRWTLDEKRVEWLTSRHRHRMGIFTSSQCRLYPIHTLCLQSFLRSFQLL